MITESFGSLTNQKDEKVFINGFYWYIGVNMPLGTEKGTHKILEEDVCLDIMIDAHMWIIF